MHTAGRLTSEDTAAVVEGALIDIHGVRVLWVENQMRPRHFLHISAEGNVFIEATGLHCIDFSNMTAANTSAGLYEGVVIDVLVSEFSETVSARLVVYKSLEIVRRRVGAHRNHCDSGTVTPHIGKAAVVGTVLYHHDQSPADIVVYRRYAGSRKGSGKVR